METHVQKNDHLLTHVQICGHRLSLEQFSNVVYKYFPIKLTAESLTQMEQSRNFVEDLVSKGKKIYGITTGFGNFSDTFIDPIKSAELQLNLIKSHACGVGEALPESIVRGMMLLRINALAKGYSGVLPSTVKGLVHLLNHKVHPVIPSQGSLGASGDLAPLSHMCLPLLGLGEVIHMGVKKPAQEALQDIQLDPIKLQSKEGLALINGTQMMCSTLALCILKAQNLLDAADIISALTVEALQGIPKAFHPLIHHVRGHDGQIKTAQNLLTLLQGSSNCTDPGQVRVQDAYSLRCIPQVHGASKDTFNYVKNIVETEMNAATDNPLIFTAIDEAISGGNFHGQPLALGGDFLAIALSEIASISERRTERLVNPTLSGLPAFLTQNGGLHSGYMILQYVAAALVSENKALAHPASVDSIPSSANQEDHVSMGSISTRKCYSVIQNVTNVLAVEYICATQALEFSKGSCGIGTHTAYELLRMHLPPLEEDREGHKDIDIASKLIESGELVRVVKTKCRLL